MIVNETKIECDRCGFCYREWPETSAEFLRKKMYYKGWRTADNGIGKTLDLCPYCVTSATRLVCCSVCPNTDRLEILAISLVVFKQKLAIAGWGCVIPPNFTGSFRHIRCLCPDCMAVWTEENTHG